MEGAPSGRKLTGNGQEVGHDQALSWLEEAAMKEQKGMPERQLRRLRGDGEETGL